MKGKPVFFLIAICFIGFLYCDPLVPYQSDKTDSRYETVDFGDFSLRAMIAAGSGDVVAVSFMIKTADSLTIWASKLRIFYAGAELPYEVRDEGKRAKDTYRLFREEKNIVYLTKRNIFSIPKGDQILLYGPRIFQVGERLYDLDTLKFVALKTYSKSY
jgi:hypothetical protein